MKVKLTVWGPVDGPGQPKEYIYDADSAPEYKIPLSNTSFNCRSVVYPTGNTTLGETFFSKILCESRKRNVQVSSEGMCQRKPKNEVMRAAMTHTHEKLQFREQGGKDYTVWLECDPNVASTRPSTDPLRARVEKKISTH